MLLRTRREVARSERGRGYVRAALDTAWAAEGRVAAALRDSTRFIWDTPYLLVNRAALSAGKLTAGLGHRRVRRRGAKGPRRASASDLVRDLARADTTKDYVARRWLHMLPPGAPGGSRRHAPAVQLLEPGATPRTERRTTTMRTCPCSSTAPPFKPGKYDEFARVVDMAPTLAAVLNTPPLEKLDGHVLRSALR